MRLGDSCLRVLGILAERLAHLGRPDGFPQMVKAA
jgi:hypothetical protein